MKSICDDHFFIFIRPLLLYMWLLLNFSFPLQPTEKTWDKIRRKISGNSSKGTRHEVLSDETSENEDEHMQNNTSL